MISGCKVSKKMHVNKIILILCSLIALSLYSQTNDAFKYDRKNLSNAYRYYNAKNYKKAAELFEYEIENSPILKIEYFENLANAYMYLKDYIGQDNARENLKVFIEAANKREEPLEHILLRVLLILE